MNEIELFPPSTYPADHARRVIAVNEQPLARIGAFGPAALSDTELLALVLAGNGLDAVGALVLAERLIAEAGSLAALAQWSAEDFAAFDGVGPVKSAQLQTLAEIARRMMMHQGEKLVLSTGAMVAAHMAPVVLGLEVEKFWVLCLNRKNRLIKQVEITSGTATAALAHPREVFRAALRNSAAAVICVHNHPSGDPAPSAPDVNVTRLLQAAAKAVDIELVDHVIVGRASADPMGKGYFSFREAGML